MKDGRIVQIGRPVEIVLNPIDDYVAEFVAGISRLKLVHAASIMRPLPTDANVMSGWIKDAPRVDSQCDLNGLIDRSIEHDGPLVVLMGNGQPGGYLERVDLMRAIQGASKVEKAQA